MTDVAGRLSALTMSAEREADIRRAASGRTRYVGRVKPTDEVLLDEIDALRAKLAEAKNDCEQAKQYAFENGAIWGYTRPTGAAIQAEAMRIYPITATSGDAVHVTSAKAENGTPE